MACILSLYHFKKQVSYFLVLRVSCLYCYFLWNGGEVTHSLISLHSGAIEAAIVDDELNGEFLSFPDIKQVFSGEWVLYNTIQKKKKGNRICRIVDEVMIDFCR